MAFMDRTWTQAERDSFNAYYVVMRMKVPKFIERLTELVGPTDLDFNFSFARYQWARLSLFSQRKTASRDSEHPVLKEEEISQAADIMAVLAQEFGFNIRRVPDVSRVNIYYKVKPKFGTTILR